MSEASARKIAEEIDSVRMAAVAAVERWRNMPVGAPGGWMSMAMCALDSALSAAPLAASEGSRQTADDAFNKAVDWADFPASQANVRVLGYKRDRAFFDAGAEWQASAAPLAAAPAVLTEADIDTLCKAMWADDVTRMWDPETCAAIEAEPDSASAKYCERLRSDDRKAMRAFIDRLSTKGDAPTKEE
jgi:hypothetical protein